MTIISNGAIIKMGKHLYDTRHMHFSGICFNLYRHPKLMLHPRRGSSLYKLILPNIKSSFNLPLNAKGKSCNPYSGTLIKHGEGSVFFFFKHSFRVCACKCDYFSRCARFKNHIIKSTLHQKLGVFARSSTASSLHCTLPVDPYVGVSSSTTEADHRGTPEITRHCSKVF